MNLIPKTLSQDMRSLFRPKTDESELLETLKKDPKNLIKFFQQATQNFPWMNKHRSLVTTLAVEINTYILNQIVPWEILLKMGSFDSFLTRVVFAFRDIKFDNDKVGFSQMMMIKECRHLREKWLANPNETPQASDMAYYITLEKAEELFKTMCTDDFSAFQKDSPEIIQKVLLQAKIWGYEKGIVKLQELLCDSTDELSIIFELFFFSSEHGFDVLTRHCLSTIENTDFLETTNALGQRCLFNYELFFDNNLFPSELPFNRKMKRARFNSYWNNDKSCDGVIARQIGFTFSGSGVVVSQTYYESGEFDKKREEAKRMPRVKLDATPFKMFAVDGKKKPSINCIVGMLRYFHACYNVKLLSFPEVSYEFLQSLSQAKNNLVALIIESPGIKEKALLNISTLFPELKALTILQNSLSKEHLSSIMNSKIDHLSLINVRLEFPDNLNDFSRLNYLGINYIKNLSKEELKRLFDIITKLKVLHAINTNNFSFNLISHPEHLEDLTIDCALLESLETKDRRSFLETFKKLKVLSIIGPLSPDMKGFFNNCIRERPDISFKFFTAGIQD